MGLALGAIPGLGGLVGLAILLPFTDTMDAFAALAIMIGLIAVTTTSDTIPSVLFSVPGTTGSQAAILDGHPMARRSRPGLRRHARIAAWPDRQLNSELGDRCGRPQTDGQAKRFPPTGPIASQLPDDRHPPSGTIHDQTRSRQNPCGAKGDSLLSGRETVPFELERLHERLSYITMTMGVGER